MSSFSDKAARLESLSVEELRKLELKNGQLAKFTTSIAWELGSFARQQAIAKFPDSSIVIDITSSSNQCLFRTVSKEGSAPDNDQWVRRKRNSALRFGVSSFLLGKSNRDQKRTLLESKFVTYDDFADQGGCVPLRLVSTDLIVATFTISGLTQHEDHLFALEVLEEFGKTLA